MAGNNYQGLTNQPDLPPQPHTVQHPIESFNVENVRQRIATRAPGVDLGDLQRRHGFSNTFTDLTVDRDAFLHLMVKGRKKKPVGDPLWTYGIKRDTAVYKRFAYVVGVDNDPSTTELATSATYEWTSNSTWDESSLQGFLANYGEGEFVDASLPAKNAICRLILMGDYYRTGNVSNLINATTTSRGTIAVGSPGTAPNWFLKNHVIKVPTQTSTGNVNMKDYVLLRVINTQKVTITDSSSNTIGEGVELVCKVVRGASDSVPTTLNAAYDSMVLPDVTHGTGEDSIAQKLEPMRTYIAGSAYHELSGIGETSIKTPYSTDIGRTQIFKETAMVSWRGAATHLVDGSPWKNEWADKFAAISWDIAQAGYWGEQGEDDGGITYTEGMIPFVLNNGNLFNLDYDTKTIDSFIDDMSAFNDPRHTFAHKRKTVYYVPTKTWNWLAKIGGFNRNNIEVSANYAMQWSGSGKVHNVGYRTFDVDGSSIHVIKDIHLDGTNVKMLGANMNAVKIRPLVGNGWNFDVGVYTDVSPKGESYKADLIYADLGYEFGLPETWAVWL